MPGRREADAVGNPGEGRLCLPRNANAPSKAGHFCWRWAGLAPVRKFGVALLPAFPSRYHSTAVRLSQSIRFCTSADGTRIAVASCGEGPVILRAAHWLSHVDYDLESPVWRPWLQALSARNRFVRYDPRGCGLSERHVADLSDRCVARRSRRRGRLDRGAALRPSRPVAGRRARHRLRAAASRARIASGAPQRLRRAARGCEPGPTPKSWRPRPWSISSASAGGATIRRSTGSSPTCSFPTATPEQHRWWGDLERVDRKRRRRRAAASAYAGHRRAGPRGATARPDLDSA